MDKSAPKRRYNSARRKLQAQATRHQIVEAARLLFTQRGYTGTTIDAIAQQAGVAAETVYATFGSKRAILSRLFGVSLVGDEDPTPLFERPGPQAVFREYDQRRQLAMFAQDIGEIMGRVAVLFEVARTAASTEPEIAELLQHLLKERLKAMQVFIEHVSANGPLHDGLSSSQAAETVWVISSAEVFRLLTVDRGWSKQQYQQWLGETLVRLLLPD
jgi:AcrR family transcriptional regulator